VCDFVHDARNAEIRFDASALNVEEGNYEIRAVSYCASDLSTPSEVVVPGRVDRVPPSLFGTFQEPSDQLWWPGDEISFRFNEELNCDRPLRFKTSVLVDGVATAVVARPVDVICKEEKIEYAFSRALITSDTPLIGKSVTVRVSVVILLLTCMY